LVESEISIKKNSNFNFEIDSSHQENNNSNNFYQEEKNNSSKLN